MFQALGDLSFVKIYLDDITVHSFDFSSHVVYIFTALKRLHDVNLKLDPAKIEAVQSFKPPQNV